MRCVSYILVFVYYLLYIKIIRCKVILLRYVFVLVVIFIGLFFFKNVIKVIKVILKVVDYDLEMVLNSIFIVCNILFF